MTFTTTVEYRKATVMPLLHDLVAAKLSLLLIAG